MLTAGSNITLTYDDAAGSLTIASTASGGGGGGGSSIASTDDLTEGSTNLYFTNARVDARIAANTSDLLSEGTYNLYFTDERVDDRVNSLLVAGSNITLSYDDAANTLTIASTASGGSGGGGGGTGDTTHIRYSSSTGQQAPLNISNVHTAGTNANAYTGQAATKDGSSGQGISVAYTAQGGETRGSGLTNNPTYKVTLTNNTGGTIQLSKTGSAASMEVKLTSSSVTSGSTSIGVFLEPPTADATNGGAVQMFSAYHQITASASGTQHTVSDAAPTNNWQWLDGTDFVFYIGLFTNTGTVSAADITLDELTFMYAGAASTYNSSTTTTQGIRLNFAYTRSYTTLNTTPAATDSLIGFYDGATASTDGNDYDWTVFVEEPNSALAADDMLVYSTSNGWTYGKPSLYALSNVNTSSAPADGQVLTWDNANSYWTPTTVSSSGGGGSSGIALTDLSVATVSASGGGGLSYDNTTGVFTFTPAVTSGGGSGSSAAWLAASDTSSATASGTNTIAIGESAVASGSRSMAVGLHADATDQFASSFGGFAEALADSSTALGYDTLVASTHSYSTALGWMAETTAARQLMLGRADIYTGLTSIRVGNPNYTPSNSMDLTTKAYVDGKTGSSLTASNSSANVNIMNLGAYSGYNGGEILIVADTGSVKQIAKIIFTHHNGLVDFTTYAQMTTSGSQFATYSVVANGSNLNIQVSQTTGGSVTYNANVTYI